MDQATTQQNTINTPMYPASESDQAPPVKKQLNKKLMILLVIIFVVILAALLLLLPRGSYKFSINSNPVPQQDFQQVYSYYKNQVAAQNFNRDNALSSTKQLFVNHFVLTQYYISHGHSESELKNEAQKLPSTANLPMVLDEISREDTVAKSNVVSELGIQSVSGKVFKVSASNLPDGTDTQHLSDLMTSRLVLYKNEVDQGLPITQIENDFANDNALVAESLIQRGILELTHMTKSHAIIPQQKFIDTVFTTKPNTTSDIMNLSSGNSLWYGFVYVESNTSGTYSSYNEWLADKTKSVKITSDFSGIK